MAGVQEHVVGNHRKTWGGLGRGVGVGGEEGSVPRQGVGEEGSRP